MLSQQDRINLFKAEIEAVEKKYQFEIIGILQVTQQGIIPGVTLRDLKPAFVAPAGMDIKPEGPKQPQINPMQTIPAAAKETPTPTPDSNGLAKN